MQRDQQGMTLIEIVIVSAIVALILPTLIGGVWLMLKVVTTRGAQLTVENRQQLARYWITRDANSATTFTTGSGTTYGTFSWNDYTETSPAAITTITRTTQADFEAAGTVRVNLDTSTIPGDMFLTKGTTPAASFVADVGPPAALGAGGHALRRPDGTFLVIRGGGTTTTYIYDPVANSFSTGPVLTGNAGAGSNSFLRPDGNFLIIHAGNSNATVIYDPVANTMTAGPTMTAAAGAGSFTIARPNGTFFVLRGNNSNDSQIYTPGTDSFAAGPTTSNNNGDGAHAIKRPDGNFLVYRGNGATTTYIYDPVANSFAAGPASGVAVGAGGHSLQRPDGNFLTLMGGARNYSRIYDPVANTFVTGPTVAGAGRLDDGAHSFELADGQWLIIKADAATNTAIYDPVNNTMAAGPATISNIAVGTTTVHRPDGTYLVIGASGATAGSAYNAGFYTSGQYNSEDFNPAGINYWTTIEWDKTVEQAIVVKVRTAATQAALQTATFRTISNSGDSIGAGAGETWLEVQIEYSRVIPGYPEALTEVWPTSGQTFYIRLFSQPDIQELRLNYMTLLLSVPYQVRYYYDSTSTTITRTTQADFEAAGTVRVNLDTSTIPGDMFLTKGTTPAASFVADVGPPAALGAGGHALRRPDGTFLVIRGGGTTTTYIYDPVANSFSTGPVLTGSAGDGSNSFQRPDGNFLIICAGNSNATVIYDPVANTMTAGPTMTAAAGAGSFTIARPDGTFFILRGNGSNDSQIYTPGTDSFAAGPTTSNNNGDGAHAIKRPDGNFLVYRGNGFTTTYIYDPVANSFADGPSSGTAVGAGGHSLQRPDGNFLTIVGKNVNNTVIYDPVANSFTAGPTVASGAQVNAGAHSFERADGQWLIIKADAATNTAIYDPVNNTMAAGPATISNIAVGTTTIHRPDGTYLVIGASGAAAGSAYNAGFYTSGQYNSEDFNPAGINYWTTIEWDKTVEQAIVVKVRTAATQAALQTATFRTISNSGDSIGAGAGETWLEVQIEYSRVIPGYPEALTEVWPTSGQTFYIRLFSQPDIQELRLNYNDPISKVVLREEMRNSVIVSVTQVAAGILHQGDVSFTYDSAQKKITVVITPTIPEAPAIGDISRTATLVAFLRTAAQPVVPAP